MRSSAAGTGDARLIRSSAKCRKISIQARLGCFSAPALEASELLLSPIKSTVQGGLLHPEKLHQLTVSKGAALSWQYHVVIGSACLDC